MIHRVIDSCVDVVYLVADAAELRSLENLATHPGVDDWGPMVGGGYFSELSESWIRDTLPEHDVANILHVWHRLRRLATRRNQPVGEEARLIFMPPSTQVLRSVFSHADAGIHDSTLTRVTTTLVIRGPETTTFGYEDLEIRPNTAIIMPTSVISNRISWSKQERLLLSVSVDQRRLNVEK